MNGKEIPSPDEIQKELAKFLKEKFGGKPVVEFFPQADSVSEEEGGEYVRGEKWDLEFDYKPKDVKEYLDRFVIRQDEAKKVLAIAVCDHYNHVKECIKKEGGCGEYTKQNIVMIGPTGVGKTYLVRCIADLIGVPFAKADATKFSETGYVGGDVEDLVRELVQKAGGDVGIAQYGIIYIDEVDKIATPSNVVGRDVSGRGVQTNLLKLMEETEVPIRSPLDVASQLQAVMEFQKKGNIQKKTINTRHILFIVSGSFEGLAPVVRRRLRKHALGFGAQPKKKMENVECLLNATSADFIQFGLEPEFIGRLPVRVVCRGLDADDLYSILKHSAGSIIRQYEQAFAAFGIEVLFTDEGLMEIARQASSEGTGARGLLTVCERVLRDYKYELPSAEICRLVVTPEIALFPGRELVKLMGNPDLTEKAYIEELIRGYERDFKGKHGIEIRFDPEAVALIEEMAARGGRCAGNICGELIKDYEYGLNLIKRNSGRESFTISREVIESPGETLSRWIRESFSGGKRNSDGG